MKFEIGEIVKHDNTFGDKSIVNWSTTLGQPECRKYLSQSSVLLKARFEILSLARDQGDGKVYLVRCLDFGFDFHINVCFLEALSPLEQLAQAAE